MKIIHLKSENIQRLKAVEVTPKDNLVVIGGNNGHGKTSLLDSIMFALGGKRMQSEQPVRNGEGTGSIEVDIEPSKSNDRTGLQGLRIRRTIKRNGESMLEIRAADGSSVSSPQKLLDTLTSKLTFDPLAFANMEPKDQVTVLKGLIPYDFSGHDKVRTDYYNERTYNGRELRQKQAENEANPFDPTFPVDELSAEHLQAKVIQLKEAAGIKAKLESDIERGRNRIKLIQSSIQGLLDEQKSIEGWLANNEPKLKEFGDTNTDSTIAEFNQITEKNERIRKNRDAGKIFQQVKALKAKDEELNKRIEELDKKKIQAIEGATLPVSGLSFSDDTGVLYQGIPFAQLSGAERLKVSLAMGIALNPTLRILLIRDGSLLDEQNLKVVAEMAKAHDMQVWIERVGKGEECSIIIEDGTVLEDRTVKQEAVQ